MPGSMVLFELNFLVGCQAKVVHLGGGDFCVFCVQSCSVFTWVEVDKLVTWVEVEEVEVTVEQVDREEENGVALILRMF